MKMTVAEAVKAKAGTMIPAIKGKLTHVYSRKQGDGKDGAQHAFQNAYLAEGDAAIKVTFVDRGDMVALKGKTVFLMSANAGPAGVYGVERIDDKQDKNKTLPCLKVYPPATVTEAADLENPQPTNVKPKPEESQSPPSGPRSPDFEPASGGSATVTARQSSFGITKQVADARRFIGRRRNGLLICFAAANSLADELEAAGGYKMEHEDIRTAATSMFISADRAGMFDDLPCGQMDPPKPSELPTTAPENNQAPAAKPPPKSSAQSTSTF